jgi:hypothetical protein
MERTDRIIAMADARKGIEKTERLSTVIQTSPAIPKGGKKKFQILS